MILPSLLMIWCLLSSAFALLVGKMIARNEGRVVEAIYVLPRTEKAVHHAPRVDRPR